ncbi:MAG: hypothetical protein LRZ94_01130 [Candidatus Pacebacteria bacterium]|nr:hypothetical protein [Candidatus Paceibacterota bacterium]
MKITRKNNKIIIEIDKYQNAYDAVGEKIGQIDNIIGIINKDELGFSYLIDRTGKGKGPDISTPVGIFPLVQSLGN